MRIDKFLKVTRIIKRRTVAADACDGGKIEVNGREAKPSKDIKEGDIVKVSLGGKSMSFRVLTLPDNPNRGVPEEMYEIIDGGNI